MSKLEELKAAYKEARSRVSEVAQQRSEFQAKLYAEAEEKVRETYGQRLRDAASIEEDARRAVDVELDRIARESVPPYPVGTVFVEWKQNRYSRERRTTGRKAVLEVCTLDTDHGNTPAYARAELGQVILRLLKKDGKPGVRYERGYNPHLFGSPLPPDWKPETPAPPQFSQESASTASPTNNGTPTSSTTAADVSNSDRPTSSPTLTK